MAAVTPGVLACSVRGCVEALARHERTYVCGNGHAFDIARSGYINLLQPQDRRSTSAGDSAISVGARARLLAHGVGASMLAAVVAQSAALDPPSNAVVVDLGCGGGDALAAFAALRPMHGIGIDLSTAAIARAVKQPGNLTWVVANADRRLPLLDAAVHMALSLNARRNPAECARVMVPGAFLVVTIPAPDDLVELRARVQGERVTRDRTQAVIDEHAPAFALVARDTVRERHHLEGARLRDLLTGTYRGARTSELAQVSSLESLEVTLASDLLIFSRN